MNRPILAIASLILISLVSCSNSSKTFVKEKVYGREIIVDTSKPAKPMNIAAIEQKVHQLINQYRVKRGLKPLQKKSLLDKAARQHSRYMRDRSNRSRNALVVSHDKFDKRMGVLMKQLATQGLAENVAGLEKVREEYVAAKLVDGWLNSPGHHKNIVAGYNMTGIGVVEGSGYTVLATQIFAKEVR